MSLLPKQHLNKLSDLKILPRPERSTTLAQLDSQNFEKDTAVYVLSVSLSDD